jgi:hypothetical protein
MANRKLSPVEIAAAVKLHNSIRMRLDKLSAADNAEFLCGFDALRDPEVEERYSLEGVFDWLQECPEQIERTVIRTSSFFS